LLRISSDNHHIRVISNDGEEHRLLMRLRDAVAKIDLEPGLYVHFSNWVARSKIVRVVRQSGREVVELASGETVPIGLKYRPDLITAGVISA
jgi:DNA-binding LytR/AlgR family response regulator